MKGCDPDKLETDEEVEKCEKTCDKKFSSGAKKVVKVV